MNERTKGRLRSRATASATALCLVGTLSTAGAFGGVSLVGVAKEWTQLANNAQLVHIASNEVRNLGVTIRQYEHMVRQGSAVGIRRALSPWQARDVMVDLRRLSEIVALGSDAASDAASIDELLRAAYPGYEHYAGGAGNFAQDYRRWNTRRHDAIRDAYYAAGLHAAQFRDEAAAAREVERQMQTAQGQMQVLQASGRMASMEVEQLQKLRQLLAVQIRMQGEILATEADRQARDDAGLEGEREAARRMAEALRNAPDRGVSLRDLAENGVWGSNGGR